MCGKFTQMASWSEVHEFSDLMKARVNDEERVFTPMRAVPVVHLDGDGNRIITPMSWGFTDRRPEGRRTPKLMMPGARPCTSARPSATPSCSGAASPGSKPSTRARRSRR